ncbi:MAG: hypothetical protein SCH70_13460 [Candidatus Methanoperedens sp.]|nr:hypothetical protein [Candidatus Methanoperedens sp.]
MKVGSVSSVMEKLKDDYDKSKNKRSWRVLQGMNKEQYDTFIAGDRNIWQIKSEEVGPGENIAVGARISSFDEELEKIMRAGFTCSIRDCHAGSRQVYGNNERRPELFIRVIKHAV